MAELRRRRDEVSADADGVIVRLEGQRLGETYALPPDFEAFDRAAPGEYRLRSTGELVIVSEGSAARQSGTTSGQPVDAVIMGILDSPPGFVTGGPLPPDTEKNFSDRPAFSPARVLLTPGR